MFRRSPVLESDGEDLIPTEDKNVELNKKELDSVNERLSNLERKFFNLDNDFESLKKAKQFRKRCALTTMYFVLYLALFSVTTISVLVLTDSQSRHRLSQRVNSILNIFIN